MTEIQATGSSIYGEVADRAAVWLDPEHRAAVLERILKGVMIYRSYKLQFPFAI